MDFEMAIAILDTQKTNSECQVINVHTDARTPTSFARWPPVEIQKDVRKSGELMHRLLLLGTDVVAVVVSGKAPDNKITVTVT